MHSFVIATDVQNILYHVKCDVIREFINQVSKVFCSLEVISSTLHGLTI